jgi:predicted amidohydrolase
MQDLDVVLVQANQLWENKVGNLDNYSSLLKEVDTCDLIILPEMFHTGFSMNVEELAEEMQNSIGINWLRQIASEKKSAIYTSLIIKENNHFYNRGVFIYPDGQIKTYDKRKSFGLAGEDKFYTAGTDKKVVEYKGWKIQLQICYDLRFPEIARNKIESNLFPTYDVLLYVANWPEKRNLHWKTLLRARAIENQCYVIGVNRVGVDGKELNYSGDSIIVDALGNENSCIPSSENLLRIKIEKEELNKIRRDLPFLKD